MVSIKKGLVVWVFIFISLNLVSGALTQIAPVKQNTDALLTQLCSNCTFNNITSIVAPLNSSQLITNVAMTKDGTDYTFLLTGNFTNALGTYHVNGVGDEDGLNTVWVYTFEVTKLGTTLDTSESLIYILLTFGVFIFFLLSLFFTLRVPYSNEVNEKGMVIKVTKLKYAKLSLFLLTYVLFVWFLNVLIGVSNNFVSLTIYFGFVSFLFVTLNAIALPLSIFILVVMFFEIIKDAKLQDNINKLFIRG